MILYKDGTIVIQMLHNNNDKNTIDFYKKIFLPHN
jgi:hypothetical protein